MAYDSRLVAPMREDMTRMGAVELTSPEQVDAELGDHQGTTLVFVNSVCGCAAGNARPGLAEALRHSTQPDRVVTVFAGQDVDATARARQYFGEYAPSSPSMALMKEGEVVWFMHRHEIEGRNPQTIAAEVTRAFDQYCTPTHPSVTTEV